MRLSRLTSIGLLLFAVLPARVARAQQSCADPARTIALSGPGACHVFDQSPAECQAAWAVTQGGGQPVSCFHLSQPVPSCQGCGPTNQAAGVCVNTCVAPPAPVPALAGAQLFGLAALLLGLGASLHRRKGKERR